MLLRVLLLYLDVANFELELQECASRNRCVAGAAGVHFVYYVCTQEFRFCSQNCGNVFRTLFFAHTKKTIREPEPRDCTSRTTVVLKNTIFNPELQRSSRAACVLETCK